MINEVNKIKTDAYNRPERVAVPPADIYESENEYVIKADMPGVAKDGVDVTFDNDVLSINGKLSAADNSEGTLRFREYAAYNFCRSFNLGGDVEAAGITATMDNGVLTLTLPKREELKPKKIQVTVH